VTSSNRKEDPPKVETPEKLSLKIDEKPIVNTKKEDPIKVETSEKLSFFNRIIVFFKSLFSRK